MHLKLRKYGPWIAAVIFFVSLVLGIWWLRENGTADGFNSSANYDAQKTEAVDRIAGIADQGIGIALGLLALLGAALLRLEQAPRLNRAESFAAMLAAMLFLLSVIAGVFVKLKLAEVLMAGLAGSLRSSLVNPAMLAQLMTIVCGLTSIAWIMARKVLGKKSDGEGTS